MQEENNVVRPDVPDESVDDALLAHYTDMVRQGDTPGEPGSAPVATQGDMPAGMSATGGNLPAAPEVAAALDVQQSEINRIEHELSKVSRRSEADRGRQRALQERLHRLRNLGSPLKGDPEWERTKLDFPDLAGTLEQRVDQAFAQVTNAVAEIVEPINQDAQQALLQQSLEALESVRSGAYETLISPDFAQWFQQQPPGVRLLADSPDVRDAYALLARFDAHSASQQSVVNRIDRISQSRRQALEVSASPRGKLRAPASDVLPEDAESQLAHYTQMIKSGRLPHF